MAINVCAEEHDAPFNPPPTVLDITENGEYSTNFFDEVLVNVEGGGGSGDYTLIASTEVEVTSTTSSASLVTSFSVPDIHTADAIIYVRIRDKAGKRNGYFYGSDTFAVDLPMANGSKSLLNYIGRVMYEIQNSGIPYYNTNTVTSTSSGGTGVFVSAITGGSSPSVNISKKNATVSGVQVNGVFTVEVYHLKWAGGASPLV